MKYTVKDIQKRVNELLKETDRICRENHIIYYASYGTVLGAVRHKGNIPWDHDADIAIFYEDLDRFIEVFKRELDKKYQLWIPGDLNYPLIYPRIGIAGKSTGYIHLDIYIMLGFPDDHGQQDELRKRINRIAGNIFYKTPMDDPKTLKAKIWWAYQKMRHIFVRVDSELDKLKVIEEQYKGFASNTKFVIQNLYDKKNIINSELLGKGCRMQFDDFSIIVPEKFDLYLKHFYSNYMELPSESYRNEWLNKTFEVE